MWQLNGFCLFCIISLQSSHVSNAASDLYVQPGRNVTIPCLLNITKSNIGSLYWQKINNSTQGFETVYSFIKFANGPGWRSPLRGYIVNFTDLVLLNVTFSHDGIYNCKILTHSAPRIFDRKAYLHVILPLLEIELRKTGTVINNGEIIELLHGEETDVECAVVGNVSPPVELGWVTSEDHNQTYVSTAMHHGPSSSVTFDGSRVTHEENITCRAVQWIAGRPYLTIETTFILKILNPRIDISNCTTQVHSQPGDCCLINVSSNVSKNSVFLSNLTCEVKNIVSPVNLTWFRQLGNQSKEIETTEGYAVSAVPDPGDINSRWTCSFTDHEGETWNMSACLYSNVPLRRSRNIHVHTLTIAATIPSVLTLLIIIGIIVLIIWIRKGADTHIKNRDDNRTSTLPVVREYFPARSHCETDYMVAIPNMENRDENRHMDNPVDSGNSEGEDQSVESGDESSPMVNPVDKGYNGDDGVIYENLADDRPTGGQVGLSAVGDNSDLTPIASDFSNSNTDAVGDNSIPTPISSDLSDSNTVSSNSNPTPIPSELSSSDTDAVGDNSNPTPIPSDFSDSDTVSGNSNPTPIPNELSGSDTDAVGDNSNPTPIPSVFSDSDTVGDNSNPTPIASDFSDSDTVGDESKPTHFPKDFSCSDTVQNPEKHIYGNVFFTDRHGESGSGKVDEYANVIVPGNVQNKTNKYERDQQT